MTEPPGAPVPPEGRAVVVATDFDRTFTRQDLSLPADSVQRAAQLRSRGVRVVLVTGRASSELPTHALRSCFDAWVVEGGAVWGKPGKWVVPPVPAVMWETAATLEDAGHAVREGMASFSAAAAAEDLMRELNPPLAWRRNRDRIDVTPPQVDKGSGLRNALQDLGVPDPWILAIGDATNDLPLFKAADAGVAVANAEPGLTAAALVQAPHPAHRGFLWAVSRLGRPGAPP